MKLPIGDAGISIKLLCYCGVGQWGVNGFNGLLQLNIKVNGMTTV